MVRVNITHEIRCDEAAFWGLFFDPAFTERLSIDALDLGNFSILELKETDREIRRRLTYQPNASKLPAFARRFGRSFRPVEEGTFDKSKKVWSWTVSSGNFAETIRSGGMMRAESLGDARVKQIVEMYADVKIAGMGALIESLAERRMLDVWDKTAAFMNRWIAEGGR